MAPKVIPTDIERVMWQIEFHGFPYFSVLLLDAELVPPMTSRVSGVVHFGLVRKRGLGFGFAPGIVESDELWRRNPLRTTPVLRFGIREELPEESRLDRRVSIEEMGFAHIICWTHRISKLSGGRLQ